MAKGDVTEVGPPIDSARLQWFIKHYRYASPSTAHVLGVTEEHAAGYNKALDDLAAFLRGAGY